MADSTYVLSQGPTALDTILKWLQAVTLPAVIIGGIKLAITVTRVSEHIKVQATTALGQLNEIHQHSTKAATNCFPTMQKSLESIEKSNGEIAGCLPRIEQSLGGIDKSMATLADRVKR